MAAGYKDELSTDAGAIERRIDTLKHLSNVQRSQFEIRQRLEWRIVFTALTFYVGAALTKIPVGLKLDPPIVQAVYLIFTTVILVHLFLIHRNHHINKGAAHKAENVLWEMVGHNPGTLFKRSLRWQWWYFSAQCIVVLIFAGSSIVIVNGRISASKGNDSPPKAEIEMQEREIKTRDKKG